MKAYKGFNRGMTCRGFQFEEGKTYHEDNADLCQSGFHACKNPLDCFGYYEPGQSVYHEVELDDVSDQRGDDSKICGKTIKIGAELDVARICQLHFEYVKSRCTPVDGRIGGDGSSMSGGDGSSLSGGDGSAMSGGYGSAMSGGNRSSMSGGDGSSLSGGYGSAMSGGDGSSISGGDGSSISGGRRSSLSGGAGSSISGGNRSSMSGGDGSSLSGGDGSAAATRGKCAVGIEGVAVARGNGCRVKGGMGALLVCAEENIDDYDIKTWAAVIVDGEKIKPDTWYKVEDGEFVEVEA